MLLHEERSRLGVPMRLVLSRASKTSNLQSGRHRACPEFPIALQDSGVARRLRPECLVVDDSHAN